MTYDIRSQNATSLLLENVEQSLTKLPSQLKSKKPWEEWWQEKKQHNRELFAAVEQEDREKIISLLNEEKLGDLVANIDVKMNDDMTPLHAAASEGSAEIVDYLLRHGASIDPVNISLRTPLHVGCDRGSKKVIELLVNAGANINAQEKDGNTPTHILSSCGWIEVLGWFLCHNPDLAIKNIYGETAVEVAANVEVRQVFTTHHKPAGTEDTYTRTVMDNMIIHNNRADMIKTLMYRGQMLGAESGPKPGLPVPPGEKSTESRVQEPRTVFKRKIVKIIEATKRLHEIKAESDAKGQSPEEVKTKASEPEGDENVGPEDFAPVKLLGKGSFGEVYLVKYKKNGKLYAMKVLDKQHYTAQNLIRYAKTERNVLCYTRHPFIVGLNFAFQTADKLFMIMDFCPGYQISS